MKVGRLALNPMNFGILLNGPVHRNMAFPDLKVPFDLISYLSNEYLLAVSC